MRFLSNAVSVFYFDCHKPAIKEARMIARVWHGWTTPQNADSYERILKTEPSPLRSEQQDAHQYG
jgi:hypothetical protein